MRLFFPAVSQSSLAYVCMMTVFMRALKSDGINYQAMSYTVSSSCIPSLDVELLLGTSN